MYTCTNLWFCNSTPITHLSMRSIYTYICVYTYHMYSFLDDRLELEGTPEVQQSPSPGSPKLEAAGGGWKAEFHLKASPCLDPRPALGMRWCLTWFSRVETTGELGPIKAVTNPQRAHFLVRPQGSPLQEDAGGTGVWDWGQREVYMASQCLQEERVCPQHMWYQRGAKTQTRWGQPPSTWPLVENDQ